LTVHCGIYFTFARRSDLPHAQLVSLFYYFAKLNFYQPVPEQELTNLVEFEYAGNLFEFYVAFL